MLKIVMSFKVFIEGLEKLQREGKAAAVKEELARVSLSQIKRDEALPLANLARRINMIQLALRILNPIVRQKNLNLEPARSGEKIEYAILLYKIGATLESQAVLNTVDFEKHPSGYLSQAFLLFSQWKYSEAIPFLKKYIEHSQINEYSVLVGRINLASALLYCGRFDEALLQINYVLAEAKSKGYKLLYANGLEISSQIAFQKNDRRRALELIEEAQKTLNQNQDLNTFYIEKVKTLLQAQKLQGAQAKDLLIKLKTKAQQLKHWETAREADFYSSIYCHDKKLFEHVYWGTPHQSYLEQMLQTWAAPFKINSQYTWELKSGNNPISLDLTSIHLYNETREMNLTNLTRNALLLLTSDFYRTFSVGQIHSFLFKDDYFNPFSSPVKIYQIIKRLRVWFKEQNLPLHIVHNGGYKLVGKSPVQIILPFQRKVPEQDQRELLLEEIYKLFKDQTFSTKQAIQETQLSKSTLNALFSWGIERGWLERIGNTRQVKYQFKAIFEKRLVA